MSDQVLSLYTRKELLDHWRGPQRARLRDLLRSGDHRAFDQTLLDALTKRITPRFYFDPSDVAERINYSRTAMPQGVARWLRSADKILQGNFPLSDNNERTDEGLTQWLRLPRNFSWLTDPCSRRKPTLRFPMDIVHVLNRHRFWVELAVAYRLTGKAGYADELKRQLVSWTKQHPPLPTPREYAKHYPRWHLLDTAIRGDTWPWTFFLMIGTEAWTPEINTLFLHQLWHHGRFLDQFYPLCIRGHGGNWTIMQAQGLLNIALLFPEFKESPRWERQAQIALTACLNRQFLSDGGHSEQSPSYHEGSLRWMCEPLYLAQLNGRAWANQLLPRLRRSTECFFQLMQPDGQVPTLSDSDQTSLGYLPGLSLLFNEQRWLRFDKPGLREALMFGKKRLASVPRKTLRPTVVSFRESGYYVMRSGDGPKDLQIIFDCGLQGGSHGHFDLLNFELCGFGKPLICDPGRLNYNLDQPDRKWIVSTPAHNTISIDGLNHERFEAVHDPHFKVTEWKVRKDYIQVSAQHRGYAKLTGKPVVGRTLRYDRKNTLILRDWGISSTEHEYTISFTLPGKTIVTMSDGAIRTTHARGNVLIKPMLSSGQNTTCEQIFWSPNYGQKEPAVRFTVQQKARRVLFETVIVAYAGRMPPKI